MCPFQKCTCTIATMQVRFGGLNVLHFKCNWPSKQNFQEKQLAQFPITLPGRCGGWSRSRTIPGSTPWRTSTRSTQAPWSKSCLKTDKSCNYVFHGFNPSMSRNHTIKATFQKYPFPTITVQKWINCFNLIFIATVHFKQGNAMILAVICKPKISYF